MSETDIRAASAGQSGEQPATEQIEWNRIAALVATVAVLFFFTRSAPFPAQTFWDLTLARDFDLSLGWVFYPEAIALTIADSSASLLGLKAVFHIAYFLLCCIRPKPVQSITARPSTIARKPFCAKSAMPLFPRASRSDHARFQNQAASPAHRPPSETKWPI